jgi:diaminopimelate epimerase
MHFWKYQGAGNDFILIDQRERAWIGRHDTAIIARLCNRHFGIGADGLILLQTAAGFDFEMIYFNADGRESTLCGNGGRCAAAFARDLGIAASSCRFMAIDGAHEAEMLQSDAIGGADVALKMADVTVVQAMPDAEANGRTAYVLDTGSPHYVRFVDETDHLSVDEAGRAVRQSAPFAEAGINVNFATAAAGGGLQVRTYERGVEGETLACGTGAVAVAVARHVQQDAPAGPVETAIVARGGHLVVRFDAAEGNIFTNIWLIGPTQQVFEGRIEFLS